MMRAALPALVAAATLAVAGPARAEDPFSYAPPGELVPKSGKGRADDTIYAPKMRFPIEEGPAYANSQVYGHGGGLGPGGGQCDKENYSYPWHDTYCESRSWDMPLCPSGTGHQGVDIRAATCKKGVHWVVATVTGTITNVGSYSVYLTADDGTRYDYLHMSDVTVKSGDPVKRGQRLGKVSNVFGGTATTVHLHFNIRQNVKGVGSVFVPPYASLVRSYEELLGIVPDDGGGDAGADGGPRWPTEPTRPDLGDGDGTEGPGVGDEPRKEPPANVGFAAEVDQGCASAPASAPTGAVTFILGALAVGAIRRRRR